MAIKPLTPKADKPKKPTTPKAEGRKIPVALTASLNRYLEETPCQGPGDLGLATTLEAMARAQEKSFWTVMGRKLSRMQVMELLVDMVAEGHAMLHLLALSGMPKARTIGIWLAEVKGFRDAMDMAERMRAMMLADEALEIMDGTTIKRAFADKARAELRLKLAGSLDPRKYGKRVLVDDPTHGTDNESEVWSRFRSILVVHADMIQKNTGIRIEVPVQDAEIVSEKKDEPRELEPEEIGMQGGIPLEEA